MNENSLDILKKRYFREGEQSWEDLCKRVCEGISNAEETENKKQEWFDIFYNMMCNMEFIPSTPCLINADKTNTGQLSSCISGNTEIYTKNGIKKMEDIIVGDEVLTHKNRFKKVIKKICNGEKDTIAMSFSKNTRKRHSLFCTDDHLLLNINNEWQKAKDISIHKTVKIWESEINKPDKFILCNTNNKYTKKYEINNNKILLLNRDKRQRCGRIFKSFNSCYNIIKNDDKLGFLFGCYMANGSITRNVLTFTINSNKQNDIDIIEKYINECFDVKCNIYKNKEGRNWVKISIENFFIMNLFKNIIGKGFLDKKIPEWIVNCNNNYKESLLNGLYMDGCNMKNNDNSYSDKFNLVLANPTLVYQTTLLKRSLGFDMVYVPNYENKMSKNPTSYTSNILQKNNLSINKEYYNKCLVYDLEVEEDNSFVAGDFYVHNCFIIDLRDNIESIYNAKSECAKIFQKNGGVGFNISVLRPNGANVEISKGKSCGTIGFMEEFNLTADVVTRNNIRKGAIKIDLNDWHPDILQFIKCKSDLTKLNFMNISVSLSDKFMNAVKNDEDWDLMFPDYSICKDVYNKEWYGDIENWINKKLPIKIYQTIKAKDLYR